MKDKRNNKLIANELGISRTTFYQWKKLPDAPKTLDIDAWRAFAKTRALKGCESEAYHQAKIRRMNAQCEAIEFRTRCAKGEWIRLLEVREQILRHAGRIKTILVQRIINEFPAKAQGLDVPAMRSIAELAVNDALLDHQAFCDEICRQADALDATKRD